MRAALDSLGAVGGESLRPTRFLLPWSPRLLRDELAGRQPFERFLDVGQRPEPMPPLGSLLQLAWCLRAAQQQHADQCELGSIEPERLVGDVTVLDDALPGRHDA